MRFLNRLQRKFSRYGIDNLMIYITATMLLIYALETILRLPVSDFLYFKRDLIFQGQVWRLITFVFIPPTSSNMIFFILNLYFYYLIGSNLEDAWGSSQFTLYYFFGMVGLIISGFLTGFATNVYLNLSLFFAFAQMFPNYSILLFFLIPIKMKYLAYVNWAFFALSFLTEKWPGRISLLFSLLNFFLFFGPDIVSKIRTNIKHSKSRKEFRRNMGQNRDIWR